MASETYVVGMITRTRLGYVLVTSEGAVRVVSDGDQVGQREDQFVFVTGEWKDNKTLAVRNICEMMTPRELDECAGFILTRHGRNSEKHAALRLTEAHEREDSRDVLIWTSIFTRLENLRRHELWPKQWTF